MELSKLKLTERRRELLERMNIHTVEELIKTYPLRYERIEGVPFFQWQKNDNVCFEGLICSAPSLVWLPQNRSLVKFKVISWNEELEISIFNRPWLSQFAFGKPITLFGVYQGNYKVTVNRYNFQPLAEQSGFKPVYSLPKSMRPSDMEAVMKQALQHTDLLSGLIPERYVKKYRLVDPAKAYVWIHNPPDERSLHQAIRTLKYEEFLCFQCVMQSVQTSSELKDGRVWDEAALEEKKAQLPYTLTADQQQALDDILQDMRGEHLMYRLVQGDVGCGKTAVAMLAIYAASLSGVQSAFLAPTEVLARQHLENLKKLGIEASLYVSALKAKEKQSVLEGLKSGSIACVVGTHALFQENVEFASLGLVIADEQQRFGVNQRRALLEKGTQADFLMMSATPIPRTYAHFLYGDIALSEIHTLPPGRQPVKTRYIPGSSMKPILKHILQEIEAGKQVYVVCAMIDENPETNLKAVEVIYEGMEKTIGSKVRLDLLHGKMKSAQKEEVLLRFARHETDLLVSTTVIEVGIDVPNATIMVIYDSDRFGLSTLHQLRGRAARGKVQGECYLLSSSKDPQAIARLKKMEEMTSGFEISQYDLMKRGPGDILGTRQSGLPSFVLGDFEKDPAIMEVCVEDAREILARHEDEAMLAYVEQAVENARYFD